MIKAQRGGESCRIRLKGMFPSDMFTRVEDELREVLEQLRRREPIFHTPEFGVSISDFDAAMAPDYWEVGASGRRYTREFILNLLPHRPLVDAASAGWETRDLGLRRLGPHTYLLTYTLHQGERISRRATIWEDAGGHWQIVYHQGTLVTEEVPQGTTEDSPGQSPGSVA
jgi:hypothetical protein